MLCVQVIVLCAHAVCDATVVEISQPTSNGVFICCLWCGKCQNMSHIMLCVQVIMLCVHAVCDTTGDHAVCTGDHAVCTCCL